ncbi:RcnB family protein [Halomonas sp. DX6]|uniref:RcnB family protein n=1 Tax=Billgrantia bachuensis TaxID=2717286 RepID=A0ABX0PPU7_9GAMM|nr:RcnB family protein [Halomonas bachuensis]
MHAKRELLVVATALGLTLGSAGLQAQPTENPGKGQGHGQGQNQGKWQNHGDGQGRGQGQGAAPAQPGRGQPGEPERSFRESNHGHGEGRVERYDVSHGPRIDEREIRRLLVERRDWIEIDRRHENLPPGIRMNLERGKPLPPGIAMQLDERVLRDLPRYDGYEWRRVGPDVILVDAANAIIYEILRDIFY